MAQADVVLDLTYVSPRHLPAAMEPQATIARWDGETLEIWSSLQLLAEARTLIAGSLAIETAMDEMAERLGEGEWLVGMGMAAAMHRNKLVRTGAFATRDLAEYHVPVHADIPAIEAHFLDSLDLRANPMGPKDLVNSALHAAAGELASKGLADTRRCPGDQGSLALVDERVHHPSPPRPEHLLSRPKVRSVAWTRLGPGS